jgi:hypothetical protein
MDRLNVWKFSFAAAIAFAALSVICAVAVVISPDATIAVFNNWFHGLELRLLVPPGGKPLTIAGVISGTISIALVGFVSGAILAGCYNLFSRKAAQ